MSTLSKSLSSISSSLSAGGESEVKEKYVPLWKKNAGKSLKSGTRHTIYWVENNPKHERYLRDGALVGSKEPTKFRTGDSYAGDWLQNKKHGFGTQCWRDGRKYQGDWKGGKRNGTGTLWTKKDGKLRKEYTGEWRQNKRHGMGIYYDEAGNKYEGNWASGKKHGQGKLLYTNGDVYEGEFENDKRSGLGILTLVNGDRYEGHWLNDVKEGPGRYIYPSKRQIYQGEWNQGTPKCGMLSDYVDDELEGKSNGEIERKIPELGLAEPNNVLSEALKETRRQRAERLGLYEHEMTGDLLDMGSDSLSPGGAENVFSKEELHEICNAFCIVDENSTGYLPGKRLILVFNELGIFPLEEDVDQLLSELDADEDSLISMSQFIQLLSALRAPDDEFE